MADSSIARRRVVPNACNECRKKRTKCDGALPCSRCESREGLVCVYEPHLKQSKEVLQAELSRLREEWRRLNAVVTLLKTHDQPQVIVDRIRSGTPLEIITGEKYREPASEGSSVSNSATVSSSFRGLAEEPESPQSTPTHLFRENRQHLPGLEDQDGLTFPVARWTSVTSNDALVNHLLGLYFCWEYPTFASLSKEHFVYDFKLGRHRFCSSLLVNAMLALGARSSDAPEARKNPSDPLSAGEHFFEEAKRLMGNDEVPTLTTIQALGLMSLRQASCGNDASSVFYARQSLRMALDIDLHRQHPATSVAYTTAFSRAELEVRTATFWGSFNLEQAWALCIGRPSQVVPGDVEIAKPAEVDEIEQEDWKPYTDTGTTSRDYHQPNNVRAVYKCFSELSEIINQGAYKLNFGSNHTESHYLLSAYHRLLEWYDALPDQLRLGANFTPTVLFTHMYYHFTILILFRPFRDLSITGSATSPREICTEASQNLFTLIKSYRDLYTLRRVPSFVPYMILTANLAHLIDSAMGAGDDSSKSAESASLSYLEEMCSSHAFAKRSLDIVDYYSEILGRGNRKVGARHWSRGSGNSKVHPANDVAGADTFFLPASPSSMNLRAGSGNFSMPGSNVSLFPQQGRRFGTAPEQDGTAHTNFINNDEDEMET